MYIIKIGGGERINVDGILQDLSSITEPFIIVHGANALRDEVAARLGMEKRVLTSVSGYSSVFSDTDAIDAILMSYAGLRNKRIVECAQKLSINAIGLSGIDGRMIQGRRNKGIRVRENGKTLIKRDYSGKPVSVNSDLLHLLLDKGYKPVLSIPIIDEQGIAINSENDDIVTCLAQELTPQCVFQFIEAPGFLDNAEDETSVVDHLSVAELEDREGRVEGRMKRKMRALCKLFEGGTGRVVIADGRTEHPLIDALNGCGTSIVAE